MKEEVCALDLLYLVKEFQDLTESRVDKIFQKERDFLITTHVVGKGKKFIRITPRNIYLTEHKETYPDKILGFCSFLRKKLSGSVIKNISQKNFERIITITFEKKDLKYFMIIELFSNGNLILCDNNYKIISALESHKWKDRIVRGGITYEFPPEQINTVSLTEEEFKIVIKKSNKDSIVKTLAVDFGLGGLYAEELCLVSKIDKSAEKITLEQIRTLYTNLKIMFSKEIHANFIEDSGEILPFELQTFVSDKKTFFESFSQALDFHLSKEIIRNQNFVLEKKLSDEINKIKQIFEQQEQTIKGLEVSEKENQKKGELIYENYELVKKLLDDLNFARKNFSWNEIKDSVKNHKVIKLINDKEGTIVLELK